MKEWIVCGAVLLAVASLWLTMFSGGRPRYRRKLALTGGDLEFFNTLRNALPDCHIFPKMAMTSLLDPVGIGMKRQRAYERIAGGQVGYAVFDEEMQLRAVVELSHRSGVSRKDLARDEYFTSAGIKTVRFHTKKLPSKAKIEQVIFARSVRQLLRHDASNSDTFSMKGGYHRQKPDWPDATHASR